MRAVLVVNPQATATTAGGRDVLAHALASELKLDIVETDYRGHAHDVARDATREGVGLVVAHGGDGTVNEVVNGVLSETDGASGDVRAPMVGVVPGGSANVFARSVGLPRDPVDATERLLHAVSCGSTRSVGLGIADGRWFTFNAGLGWDADVVAGVDRRRGKRTGPWLYTRAALACYLRPPRGRARLRIELPDAEEGSGPIEVRTVFVSNSDPWSYLGNVPIRLNAGCSFDTGLGFYGLRGLGPFGVLRSVRQALTDGGTRGDRHSVRVDDVPAIRVSTDTPVNFQVDGDHIGTREHVEFRSVPDALTVAV